MFVQSGEEFEHYVAQVLGLNGHHAEVTQASGDYGVDIVLNGDIAVQVKFYGSVVGPTAVQEVAAGRAIYKCSQAWVVTNSTFTPAAVTLAEANGVRLIGGEELRWMAENPDTRADDGKRYVKAMKAAKREAAAREKAMRAATLEAQRRVAARSRKAAERAGRAAARAAARAAEAAAVEAAVAEELREREQAESRRALAQWSADLQAHSDAHGARERRDFFGRPRKTDRIIVSAAARGLKVSEYPGDKRYCVVEGYAAGCRCMGRHVKTVLWSEALPPVSWNFRWHQ